MPSYLNYKEICKLYDREKKIIVNCYYNNIMWICPDPTNKNLVQKFDNLYNQNKFSHKRKLRISNEDLQNQNIWMTLDILLNDDSNHDNILSR